VWITTYSNALQPALIKLWISPANPLHFIRCIVLCAFGSFMFGWHVHEKAVLLMIIPLRYIQNKKIYLLPFSNFDSILFCSLLAVLWRKEAQIFLLLSTIGHYSLTPLLFTPLEVKFPFGILLIFHYMLHSQFSYVPTFEAAE
jgi:alpha-1,3-glucosyltransferase